MTSSTIVALLQPHHRHVITPIKPEIRFGKCHVITPIKPEGRIGGCHVVIPTRRRIRHVGRRGVGVTTTTQDVLRDAGATAAALGGAFVLVMGFDSLTRRHLIPQGFLQTFKHIFGVDKSIGFRSKYKSESLSRKLVHILSGLLFMAFWPIFSNSTGARYFASLVPVANCVRLLTYGLSLVSDEGLIKSVTREGKPEELLRGPLYYVLVLIFCVLVFWRDSPIGVISLAMMCGGDGIADIVGRNFGSVKIPYNQKKSWAGSISMFVFGSLVSIGMLYYYSTLGYFDLDWSQTVQKVALVSLVATLVESLSTSDTVDDNISVPLASMHSLSPMIAYAGRPLMVKEHEDIVDHVDGCEGRSKKECLLKTTLNAHTDYIYTQSNSQHKDLEAEMNLAQREEAEINAHYIYTQRTPPTKHA